MLPRPSAADDSHQKLLDQLDMARIPRPFRNPHWKPSARRNKNVKQILSETSRKEASVLASQNNSGASTPFAAPSSTTAAAATPATENGTGDGTPVTPATAIGAGVNVGAASRPPNIAQAAQSLSTLVLEKNFRTLAQMGGVMANGMGPAVTYTNIESAPSLHPSSQKRYCDITGLPAPYTDPKTRLRYHDKEVFAVVRSLGQGVAESYLEVRGAHVVLK
ncbi:conserved hypothetical protein [Histoplasma capsulatum G186AR]|uniref:Vps72/YL1 C-terminal domain-containing protein n=2 Tax=Ajellomyces capsulatus TaxID=5037 RepID=C0NZ65_AJECG|nr:uncharacterized protein HCBG_08445 [Histoplasma capsulatum G186AR]EEH03505.1 conserved hypothetical protein [Histoplasma capsulatum G186AR]KAG5295917.1 chromatin-remodeling complex subunit ies6 [Histoplasma capsulatum]QSS73900.1 chromatin-remodeling complex subunit ies6 [Histoplasma capsulatum G186AR]